MCGRYVSISTPEQLAEHFGVEEIRTDDLGARYNVAPTLDVYAIIEKDTRRLGAMRWGFVPFWAPSLRKGPAPINARIETIARNQMFKDAFARRRCLLPADGFYEWQSRQDRARKQPFWIHHPTGEPLAFAGIYGSWRDPSQQDGDPVFSAAIVTTAAVGAMTKLHDRMPVILPQRLWSTWLTAEDDARYLREVVAACDPPDLIAEAITDRVNNVRNEGPDLLEPGTVS